MPGKAGTLGRRSGWSALVDCELKNSGIAAFMFYRGA
jgi:hypothetical protein